MSSSRAVAVCLALLLLPLMAAGPGQHPAASGSGMAPPSGPSKDPYEPGHLLVRLRTSVQPAARTALMASVGARPLHTFITGAELWQLGPGQAVPGALAQLAASPMVLYAEPDYLVWADAVPSDVRYSEMWELNNTGQTGGTPDADIDAPEAWSVSTGSTSVVVAILDTGIDYYHADLTDNVWTNPGEIPANGVDDDFNGFVDDVHGYDFANDDGDPIDDNGHGTHTAGTVGAVGDNQLGVTGVCWRVSLMALKFLGSGGSGSTTNAMRALEYAIQRGVDLTSNSWGGGSYSQSMADMIYLAGAHEIAFVASAGNSGTNNDVRPSYPSSYPAPNIISVAATDHQDQLAAFSNFGVGNVDLAAPGVNILSTFPGSAYGVLSGTSMACPHVSGAAALLRALLPGLPVSQIKAALLSSVDRIPSLDGKVLSGGRLNLFRAIAQPDSTPPGGIFDLRAINPGSSSMLLLWTATGDDDAAGTAATYDIRYSTAPIDAGNFTLATPAAQTLQPASSGQPESIELTGLTPSTSYFFALKALDEWGNAGPISNVATGLTLPPPTMDLSPPSLSGSLRTGEATARTVTLRNAGDGTLDFSIPAPQLERPGALAAGGPDHFGYRWSDSDEPGGPTIDWIDISTTGLPVPFPAPVDPNSLDDDNSGFIPLGFDFPFYGRSYASVNVNCNGYLSFTDQISQDFTNDPLPSTGSPAALLAVYHDDLHFRGVPRATYLADGSRFIVQFTDVDRFSSASPSPAHLTFQVILYPDGRIVYQYLSMVGVINAGTIGLQNHNRSDGLTVVFNRTYVHDNLAVEIVRLPQWLTVTPESGRLLAGQSIDLAVMMNAATLPGGDYSGTIDILSNDPNRPHGTVSAALHVDAAPVLLASPSALAYGTVFLGDPHHITLSVSNMGTLPLTVSSITPSDPQLAVSESSFILPVFGARDVTVTLNPSALGPFTGSLTLSSDDPGQPIVHLAVTASIVPPPVMRFAPAALTQTLQAGSTAHQQVEITNTGGSPLLLTAAADQGTGFLVVTDEQTNRQGGPDAFGYRFRDSDEPSGPAYGFKDISATGTPLPLTGDDELSGSIPMGLSFPYYGSTFTSLKVCTNGFVTFDPNASGPVCAFNNEPLPTPELPRWSIAAFWDDLHFRGIQRARYALDGSRFIVQFTGVDRIFPAGVSDLTFQIQLYNDGRIQVHYQTMASSTLASATIGIQDGSRTIALQAASDESYIHDTMAIQFSKSPDWLRVTPAAATVPAGESQVLDVEFSAAGRGGGTLEGSIVLGTNIPGQGQVTIPASVEITGSPQVGFFPAAIDFGQIYTGLPSLRDFQVLNIGSSTLTITGLDTTDPSLTVDEPPGPTASFELGPGELRLFNLRWLPSGAGPLDAQVRVFSNDPAGAVRALPVTGVSLEPPALDLAPLLFDESLAAGAVVTRPLHLANTGLSDLSFSTLVRSFGAPVAVHPSWEGKKGVEEDPRPGILAQGGSDAFGYRWRDSDTPGGPVLDWTDIDASGSPVQFANPTGDEENSGPVPIGFAFPFYGRSFTTVNITSNGWLSFTDLTSDFSNDPLPNASSPENLLAVFHDDLHFRAQPRAHYLNDGSRFIVQYSHVDRVGLAAGDYTFQVILYPTGRIVYQYLEMLGPLTSATVGIQNGTRDDGLTVVFNAPYVRSGLAVEFVPPPLYLTAAPADGSVPPGGSVDLDVRMDATGLTDGTWSALLELSTNDPARSQLSLPVTLRVAGIADVHALPAALAFPQTYLGFSGTQGVDLCNQGTKQVQIGALAIQGPFTFTGLAAPVTIAPGFCRPLSVTFTPLIAGTLEGSLRVTSDDPDQPQLIALLSGAGLVPPAIALSPGSISTALPPGGARSKTITLRNTGSSPLSWSSDADTINGTGPATTARGGPDRFGYRWRDSDQPGGPVFNWIDVRQIGGLALPLSGDDAVTGALSFGFTFPFYGSNFQRVRLSTNGWISFTSTLNAFENHPLPSTDPFSPENLIAPFWDDLFVRGQARIWVHSDGTRLIVQYQDLDRHDLIPPTPSRLTFQVILYKTGRIVFQYLSMNGPTQYATVGMQNNLRDDGLTVAFDEPYIHDGLAVEFTKVPQWIQLTPPSGTIAPGGKQFVAMSLDAQGLPDGDHAAMLELDTNDPYHPVSYLPVSLKVGTIPAELTFVPDVLLVTPSGADDPNGVRLPELVRVAIELPGPYSPRDIRPGTILINDTVKAGSDSPQFTDLDGDGVSEMMVTVNRRALAATLAPGAEVPVTVQGEVADQAWFRSTVMLQVQRVNSRLPPLSGSR